MKKCPLKRSGLSWGGQLSSILLSASKIWCDKRSGLWWEWSYKRCGLWWEWPYKRGNLWWEWSYKRCGLWCKWPYKSCGLWWEWSYKRGNLWWEWPYKRGNLWWEWPYKRGNLWWEWFYKRGTTLHFNIKSGHITRFVKIIYNEYLQQLVVIDNINSFKNYIPLVFCHPLKWFFVLNNLHM